MTTPLRMGPGHLGTRLLRAENRRIGVPTDLGSDETARRVGVRDEGGSDVGRSVPVAALLQEGDAAPGNSCHFVKTAHSPPQMA